MPYSKDVHAAEALARKAHAGQTDKAGRPYILHPERVAGRLPTPETQVVGWLHDTVEDTGVTLKDIAARFGPDTAAAVESVTHWPGESDADYMRRVKANPVGRLVKISDLIDNSNLARLPAITRRDILRQQRYNQSLQYLLGEEETF